MDIYIWGAHSCGQLGLGYYPETNVPIPASLNFSRNVISVSCGNEHTVFLTDDGTVWTCGDNSYGQLGHSKGTRRPVRVERLVGKFVIAISAGSRHTVALDNGGTCYTWGNNSIGQLGMKLADKNNENKSYTYKPIEVDLKEVVQVVAGDNNTMMLTKDGKLYISGTNENGQLGIGDRNVQFSQTPVQLSFKDSSVVSRISGGGAAFFAKTASGIWFGWGRNYFGSSVVGNKPVNFEPIELNKFKYGGLKEVAVGNSHAVFLTEEGQVYTSGDRWQLGNSTCRPTQRPRRIEDFGLDDPIVQVQCGSSHTLCLTKKNSLYAFGAGESGQLGIERGSGGRTYPEVVSFYPDNVEISSISAGGYHSVALRLAAKRSVNLY